MESLQAVFEVESDGLLDFSKACLKTAETLLQKKQALSGLLRQNHPCLEALLVGCSTCNPTSG